MVELRWPMRAFKVKFPQTLCDPGQLRDRGGWIVPVDIEADALCIGLTDRGGRRQHFEETLHAFLVPGQSCRGSFVRPVIETKWCSRSSRSVAHLRRGHTASQGSSGLTRCRTEQCRVRLHFSSYNNFCLYCYA